MRPVTRVDPTGAPHLAAYPFYNNGSLATNQPFSANYAVAIAYNNNHFTAANRTVDQIQNDLLTFWHAGGNPFHGGSSVPQRRAAVKSLKKRLAELYRPANAHLTYQFGAYCSYCEIYKPGHEIDVEHKLPKKPYPLRTVWWANFLQGCSRCNSSKGQKPTRGNAAGWAGGAPTEPQLMTAALNHYFWPDTSADSFQRLTYELRDADNAYALIPVPAAVPLFANLHFTDYAMYADVELALGGGLTAGRHVEVTVSGAATVAGLAAETGAQLANVGLDTRDTARAGYRTQTYYRVLNAIGQMYALIPNNLPQTQKRRLFSMGWQMFMIAASTMGNYSTIVTALLALPQPNYMNDGYADLGARFIHDSDPANAGIFSVYAGTNTAQIP